MKKPEFEWDEEFQEFLRLLPEKAESKLVTLVQKIEMYGLLTAVSEGWIDKLETNLYEIRTSYHGLFLRGIYFQIKDNRYYITHGFKKKSNLTPEKEKRKARIKRKRRLEGEK